MQFRSPGLALRADRPLNQPEAAPDVPMSAARLAAETAFGVSRASSSSSPAEQPPTVIVRRSRGLGPEAARPQAPAEPASAAETAKGPRTFRLGTPAPAARDVADGGEPLAAPAAVPAATAAQEPRGARRKRRVAAEQRPGPVVQIFKAPVTDTERLVHDHTGGGLVHGNGMTRAEVATLAAMLAGIQPVLEDIRRARAFRVLDGASAGRWQALAAAAETIRRQIRVLPTRRSNSPI